MHDEDQRPLIGPAENETGPSLLIDEARERLRLEDERNTEGKRLARRLFIAFALIALLGVVFYIVLPRYGVHMPAILPLLCFGAILVGTLLSARDDAMSTKTNGCACTDDDGRPVGCCQGPRPLNAFKQPKRK